MALNQYENLPPWPPPAWQVGPAPAEAAEQSVGILRLVDDLGPLTDAFLDLELRASEPYGLFVYGSHAAARAAARYLLDQGTGEFAPPRGRLVLGADGAAVGMLATLGWRELQLCRLQAALALHQSGILAADPTIPARIRLARQALLAVGDGDLYVSRLAAQEHGIGLALLRHVAREARSRGVRQLVLEVSPQYPGPMKLYADFGFKEVTRRQVADPHSGRTLIFAHMVRRLEAA